MNKTRIIGRSEIASFPNLKIDSLKVKVDTGAFTSSIHCSSIVRVDDHLVRCIFLDTDYEGYTGKEFEFKILKEVEVKSSNGYGERRLMIRSEIILFGESHEIDLTLTHREKMKHAVLIGRKFLHGKFLVDVDMKYNKYVGK